VLNTFSILLQIYKFYLRSKRISFVSDWLDDEQDILIANLKSNMDIALEKGEHISAVIRTACGT
jgi:type IV secretory pathway VirB9-like protein